MKKDKFCINRVFLLFVLLIAVSIGAFALVNKLNKSNLASNSKAAAPADSILMEVWGQKGQTCGTNDQCLDNLKCYSNELNPKRKTCQALEDVCGKSVNTPCCKKHNCLDDNLVCNRKVVTSSTNPINLYLNPWNTGRCESKTYEVGDYNQPCKYKVGDRGRCNNDLSKGRLYCVKSYVSDPWNAYDKYGHNLAEWKELCKGADEVDSNISLRYDSNPYTISIFFDTDLVAPMYEFDIGCGSKGIAICNDYDEKNPITYSSNYVNYDFEGCVCKYNNYEDLNNAVTSHKLYYTMKYNDPDSDDGYSYKPEPKVENGLYLLNSSNLPSGWSIPLTQKPQQQK